MQKKESRIILNPHDQKIHCVDHVDSVLKVGILEMGKLLIKDTLNLASIGFSVVLQGIFVPDKMLHGCH